MREIELKFVLAEPPAKLWARAKHLDGSFATPRTRTLRSLYYDTPDRALRDAGITLRTRRDGRRSLQTVKAGRQALGGFTDVQESETAIRRGAPDPTLVPDDALRSRIVELCDGKELVVVADMRFRRSSAVLTLPGGAKVEISTDVGTISAGGASASWNELEIERVDGSPRALFEVANALYPHGGLRLSRLPKSARAELLAAEGRVSPLPAPRNAIDVPLAADMSIEAAARDIMRECADQICVNMDVVRDTDDMEGPHQLRIGLRRLRSWFSIFQRVVRSAELGRLAGEAAWLAGEVGRLRDMEVAGHDIVGAEAARYPDESSLAALADLIARHSADERARLLPLLEGSRVQAFELDLIRFVETSGWVEETDLDQSRRLSAPVSAFADEALGRRWKKTRKRARGLRKLGTGERHELRKELKKLRYAFDFFGSLYDPKRMARLSRRLKALQDVFGEVNDAAMVRRLLADPAFAALDDPRLQRAAGWILAVTQLRAETTWTEAARLWRRLRDSRRFWTQD
ncbi:MAG: CHAD domain-containing protein [Mesorhizobium sp.]|nr:CHAD domain-containing protein [Mesorhizobium sp.]MCO5160992.1 CHAD domain-containing protein [Mesorhizobium sp.]